MAGTAEYEELNKNLEIVDGHAVKAPEDYQDPEQLYHVLIERVRKYHPSADITMIEKAYRIGKEAHRDQVRKSLDLAKTGNATVVNTKRSVIKVLSVTDAV